MASEISKDALVVAGVIFAAAIAVVGILGFVFGVIALAEVNKLKKRLRQ